MPREDKSISGSMVISRLQNTHSRKKMMLTWNGYKLLWNCSSSSGNCMPLTAEPQSTTFIAEGAVSSGRPSVVDGLRTIALKLEFGVSHNHKFDRLTMFGVTTPCVNVVKERLNKEGYETLVFHATGVGKRAMEDLVRGGFIQARLLIL
ncbi:hypothetical protein L2E82_35790 [Cichorium intybus]|uniref:Uncharacterized protein n=1 Tax=Cichorium intybus TaxID=13427 RepID=A0ACB9BPR1_CICIN|nr:hypothetical protein L2E82_35790 [Cichorium intybus]